MSPGKFLSWVLVILSISKDELLMLLLLGKQIQRVGAASVLSPAVTELPREAVCLAVIAGGTREVKFILCPGHTQAMGTPKQKEGEQGEAGGDDHQPSYLLTPKQPTSV